MVRFRRNPGTTAEAWIGFLVDEPLASQIALPDGHDADELRLNLAYLGAPAQRDDWVELVPMIERLAVQMAPLQGQITAFSGLSESGKAERVVARLDLPGIELFRQALVDTISIEFPINDLPGWQPRIILGEFKQGKTPVSHPDVPLPIEFDLLSISIGEISYELPLLGL